jgi:predicted Zn-ribbon and HTH transcriptional regulator
MNNTDIIKKAIKGSLDIIDQDREKEIISRRFGLTGHRETLEQIGEMLSITRERVRQLEKAILIRLRIAAEDGKITDLAEAEKLIIRNLTEMGRIAKITDLATKIYNKDTTAAEKASLAFLGDISAHLTLIEESDTYHISIGISQYGDERAIKSKVDKIVETIKSQGAPITIDDLDTKLSGYEHPSQIAAIASVSKLLSTLNSLWGLAKWPTVNPRNIRDKIFVILEEHKEPMHFADIAKSIADSNFKRKNVTVQAIHNELIKDNRFVLIGRGIYALDSWGYVRGTVSDMITKVLLDAKQPLSREEIVRRVLKFRKVKETTILLNLQNKSLFTRIGKTTYKLAN